MSSPKKTPSGKRKKTVNTWWGRQLQSWRAYVKRSPLSALLLKVFLWTGLVGVLSLALLVLLVYSGALGELPGYAELRNIRNNTASEVYSEDGITLGRYFMENRVNASIDEISPHIIQALISTEDARFFKHNGIDIRAWVRVLIRTVLLSDESGGGGSTLSQQLAKNLYPRRPYPFLSTVINKFREMFTAMRLERTYSKETLLNLYLNTVAFSENTYGVKVAAQRFFSTTPQRITIVQAATLIGMLKGPTIYNPVRYPERALQRRNTVINQMARYGYLEPEQAERLKAKPLGLQYQKDGTNRGLATHFRENLRLELERLLADYRKPDGSPYNLYTDGLKIYTTINGRMQRYAEEAVREHLSGLQLEFNRSWKGVKAPWEDPALLKSAMKQSVRYKSLKEAGLSEREINNIFNTPVATRIFSWKGREETREMTPMDSIRYHLAMLRAGFMAMDPRTGVILAWVGGADFQFFQYDQVKSRRQVGSTFKPIVYAAALMEGIPPCTYTENVQTTYSEYTDWSPANADDQYGGFYSMEGALSKSINTVAVDMLMQVGVGKVRTLANDMGISNNIPKVPAIALGAANASLREMLLVYATLANKGRRPLIHYLDRIETADGTVLQRFSRPSPSAFRQVVPEENAAMITRMLQTAVNEGTGIRLRSEYGFTIDIAGKTGTTQNNTDGWFLGYTPRLVAGVWVGAELPQVHFRTTALGQGARSALPVWAKFIKKVHNDGTLTPWRGGTFEPLPEPVAEMMACPPFLEQDPPPVEEDDSWFNF